jgi:pSer/pThr/pTyr-binding forkhead associated (FHA) protein
MPRPSVTLIPGSTTPPAPTPPPRQPQVPVYKPSQHAAPPPHPTPISTSAQQPTARQPIKARPTSQPVTDSNDPWGKLVFSNGRELELSGERVLVGRVDHDVPGINPDIDLQDLPGGDTTSRIHALIEHIGSAYMLTDLNSTNATRLNNKRLEPDKATAINDGDTLQFGKVTCTFKRV